MTRRNSPGFFDSDRDVAALVYAVGEDPDALLLDFTRDLAARGVAVVGLLQRRCGGTVEFALMPGRLPCSTGLSEAALALGAALEQGPDLLVVNRFGSAELSGGGLLDVLVEAAGHDIPVLIAVPEALFPAWLDFTDGLAVRLSCSRSGLERWWRSLGSVPTRLPTLCERLK